jgi:hypothetical protein
MRRLLAVSLLAAVVLAAPSLLAKKKVRRATRLSEARSARAAEAPRIELDRIKLKGRSQRPQVVIEIPRVPPAFDVGTSRIKPAPRKPSKPR